MLFHILKILLCALPTVRTSRPTTRPPLPIAQIFRESFQVILSGFLFLYDCYPANPFITRKRRESIPKL